MSQQLEQLEEVRINHLDEVFRLDLQQNLEFYENSWVKNNRVLE